MRRSRVAWAVARAGPFRLAVCAQTAHAPVKALGLSSPSPVGSQPHDRHELPQRWSGCPPAAAHTCTDGYIPFY